MLSYQQKQAQIQPDGGVYSLTKVSVACICDRNYVIATAVAITSLACNKKTDSYYDIYIIKASAEKFKGIKKFSYIIHAACLKFDLPVLIPDKDKVLYLDSDVVIQNEQY